MFTLAKLVFKSYMPKQLEMGMWFTSKHKDIVYGKVYEYLMIHELQHVPQDMDSYIAANGAPVEPYIVQPMQNPDDKEVILATPDQIGWWDQGDTADDLEDLTPKIINEWIYGENGTDGDIAIETIDEEDNDTTLHKSLVLFYGKVTMRHVSFAYEPVEDDNDDYEDDYEDMDWEDDEPEEDSAGYTISDRYNPDDYETE